MQRPSLQVADYIIFGGMFVLSIANGFRYAFVGKGSQSKETYFVGDRRMHFLPVAISLLITYQSSNMMLGLPAEGYYFGIGAIILALAHLVPNVLHAYITAPLVKPLGITSIYEYIEMRFNSRRIRIITVSLSIIHNLIRLSIVLYTQAIVGETVLGLNMWASIVIMDVCAVIYTSLGGIKTVVWTDVFHGMVMFVGIFAVIIKGTIDTGGASKVIEIANAGQRLQFFNFDPDPTIRHTVWTILPTLITGLGIGFDQGVVQRIVASKSITGAKRSVSSLLSVLSILIVEDLLQPQLKNASDAHSTLVARLSVVFVGAASLVLCITVTYVDAPLQEITMMFKSSIYAPFTAMFLMACFFPSVSKKGLCVGLILGAIMSLTMTIGGNFAPDVKPAKILPLGRLTCGADNGTSFNVTSVVHDHFSNVTSSSFPANDTATALTTYDWFFSMNKLLSSSVCVLLAIGFGILGSYILGRNRPGDINPKYFLEISESALVCLPARLKKWIKSFGPQFKTEWKMSTITEGEMETVTLVSEVVSEDTSTTFNI